MSAPLSQFTGVTILTKANVYFDGNVISHTVLLPGGAKKTIGVIRPGQYHFNTAAAERMEIVAGDCRVTVDGAASTQSYPTGASFEVPGNSGFTIEVAGSPCEYICSFLK
jgi:uncharacterized protein YaiE (UPF0345 family)